MAVGWRDPRAGGNHGGANGGAARAGGHHFGRRGHAGGRDDRENRRLYHLIHPGHAQHEFLWRGIAGNLDEHAVFPGVVELLVIGDGNPLLRRLIEVLRVVVTFFRRGEAEFGRWRRRIIDGELEVRIAVRCAVGMEPN